MGHSVCLAAHVSGGFKSHSTRGPGLISKGGGSSSPAEVRMACQNTSEGRASTARWSLKGLRRNTRS